MSLLKLNHFKRNKLAWTVSALTAAPAGMIGQLAFAQQEKLVEEVVVTASRREEGIQEIPFNITAVTGENLKEVGASDISKMSQFIPGLQIIDTGARSVGLATLRGLNVGALEASENQGSKDIISRYVNDTPLTIDFKLIDIERVEVLRGPQGTLYGRGAMGGTLRYILNKPDTEEFSGEINTRLYQNHESESPSYEINGVVNIPLSDTFALRMSGGFVDEEGFVDYENVLINPGVSNDTRRVEDANSEETTSFRASLRWEPRDDLYLQFNYFLQNDEAGGRQAVNEPFTGRRFGSALRYEEPGESDSSLANIELNWQTDYVEIFSTTSLTNVDFEGQRDQTDLLIVDIFPGYADFPFFSSFTREVDEEEVLVHETRFLSTGDGPIDWIAGFYYEDEDDKGSSEEFTPGYQDWAGIDTGVGELEFRSRSDTNFQETAVFGELTYNVTDDFQVTLGARHFEQEEDVKFDCTLLPIFWFFTRDEVVEECESGTDKQDDQVFKFNSSYNVSDDVMFYFTWAEGFRRGGQNLGTPLCPAGLDRDNPGNVNACLFDDERSFTSDKVTNWELGWHTTLGGNTIFNGALFVIDWTDLQVPTKSDIGAVNITRNGREGEISGVEVAVQTFLTENFKLDFWATYYDHGLSEDAPEITGFENDPFPGVPDIQYNIAAEYTVPMDTANVVFRGNFYYKDEVTTRLNDVIGSSNEDFERLDDYRLFNISAAYEMEQWNITLFADNVFDEYYATGARGERRYGLQGQFEYVGSPRVIGIEAGYKF